MNVAMDFAWNVPKDAAVWQVEFCNGLLAFFKGQNVTMPYGNQYNLPSGTVASHDHSPGLVAMNAVCALASNTSIAWDFVGELWGTATPSGKYRYYDGMLYIMGFMHLAGEYKYYGPEKSPTPAPVPHHHPSPLPSPAQPIPSPSPHRKPQPQPQPQPSPSPSPSKPSWNVEFSRNGRCMTWVKNSSSAIVSFGQCYKEKTRTFNLWNLTGSVEAFVVKGPDGGTTNFTKFIGNPACSVESSIQALQSGTITGRLTWNTATNQLVLINCTGHAEPLCAGDHGELVLLPCSDQRTHGWNVQTT